MYFRGIERRSCLQLVVRACKSGVSTWIPYFKLLFPVL